MAHQQFLTFTCSLIRCDVMIKLKIMYFTKLQKLFQNCYQANPKHHLDLSYFTFKEFHLYLQNLQFLLHPLSFHNLHLENNLLPEPTS